jgi:hypothetical protein
MPMPPGVRCPAPGCTRPDHLRGLCCPRYDAARYRIKRGEATWQQLEAAGQCMPGRRTPCRNGRK